MFKNSLHLGDTMTIEAHKTVILEQNDDSVTVQCACGNDPCEACQGSKQVRLDTSNVKERLPEGLKTKEHQVDVAQCYSCLGSGRVTKENRPEEMDSMSRYALEYLHGKSCEPCKGIGALVAYFPRLLCKECQGGGYTISCGYSQCFGCSGIGTIYKEVYDFYQSGS